MGFVVGVLGLLITKFYGILGSQMFSILDAQLLINRMELQLHILMVYCENIRVLL